MLIHTLLAKVRVTYSKGKHQQQDVKDKGEGDNVVQLDIRGHCLVP